MASLLAPLFLATLVSSVTSAGAEADSECAADLRDFGPGKNLIQKSSGVLKDAVDAQYWRDAEFWADPPRDYQPSYLQEHSVADSGNYLTKPSTRGAMNKIGAETNDDGMMSIDDAVTPTCRTLINASRTLPHTRCPAECPFWAETIDQKNPCMFKCVVGTNCGNLKTDPHARIADKAGFCRRCMVPGCHECADLPTDNCRTCAPGYMRLANGQCQALGIVLWAVVAVIASVLGVVIVVWYAVMLFRSFAAPNHEGVAEGREYLKKSILMKTGVEGKEEWPLTTNLLSQNVGGRGTMLLFNFQAALAVWALLAALCWGLTAWFTNPDLFHLGRVAAVTPRQYCTVILWGHMTQMNYIYVKYTFCGVLYVASFIGAIAYAVFQQKRFNKLDADSTTMMDFAALATGLPIQSGTHKVEEGLKRDFEKVTKSDIVGVSVCWNFAEQKDLLDEQFDREITTLDEEFRAKAGHTGFLQGVQSKVQELRAKTSPTPAQTETAPAPEVPRLGPFGTLVDTINSQIGFAPVEGEKN